MHSLMNDFYVMIENSLCLLFIYLCMRNHTDLKVGTYSGEMRVDLWDGAIWKEEMAKHEVRVFAFQWPLEYVIVILY
jgi:hypothetical protein